MRSILAIFLMAAFLSGCSSQVPLAKNAPLSTQLKARSTHHWDILADDVARETFTLLEKEPKSGSALRGKAFFVVPQPGPSSFDKAFRDLLITRMVNRGLPVVNRKGVGVDVQYETQVVRHNSFSYGHVPGTLTALSAGVWVVRELAKGSASLVPGGFVVSALADWGLGKYAMTTPTELIVTTSIAVDSRYLYRKSSIYYIETDDADLYQDGGLADDPVVDREVKRLEVVGK